VAVAATAALAIVLGPSRARRRLPLAPVGLAATGVGLALLSGLAAPLLGRPYLTHLWATVPLGFTELKVSTVLVFDLGVLLAVWGTLSGYVLALLSQAPPQEPPP
jgi:multicomponent Na+:H+ antiporter subunit B